MQLFSNRIDASAAHLAVAIGVKDPIHVDAIAGLMLRKLEDGMREAEAYEEGRLLAKTLAKREAANSRMWKIVGALRASPLLAIQAG